jgi:hypothetical protein
MCEIEELGHIHLRRIPLGQRCQMESSLNQFQNRRGVRPRRERNTNKLALSGSWPMTVFTGSARRSKPQRMSVEPVASQMRTPCAPSNAPKLGRPIMLRLQYSQQSAQLTRLESRLN